MAARSLRVPYETFLEQNQKHSSIASAIQGLDPALQKALAELVMIRLFDDLQEAIAGVAFRLACGANYVDGSAPTLLTGPARSTAGARDLLENHNRPRHKHVKWSLVKYTKESTKYVIDQNDPFIRACDAYSLTISEMQVVRNRIAHRNARTRATFDVVLRRYYGGAPKSITPGALLLTRRSSPSPLFLYLAATRVLMKDCVRA